MYGFYLPCRLPHIFHVCLLDVQIGKAGTNKSKDFGDEDKAMYVRDRDPEEHVLDAWWLPRLGLERKDGMLKPADSLSCLSELSWFCCSRCELFWVELPYHVLSMRPLGFNDCILSPCIPVLMRALVACLVQQGVQQASEIQGEGSTRPLFRFAARILICPLLTVLCLFCGPGALDYGSGKEKETSKKYYLLLDKSVEQWLI